ncbi:MAG TPA: hypothetical protein VNJ02_00975 [Vicinamibacterales bacterium]|nr:hypothetical protein [Vicinamibacterales bacterium]
MNTIALVLGTAMVLAGASTTRLSGQDAGMKPMMMMKVDQGMVDKMLMSWKAEPKAVAMKLIAKYGLPQEASANRLIWMNNGPWKFSELVNEEIQHDFPMPHHDMLRQGIAWKVPADKFDELAEYDGSVIVERTKGEVSARCDKEEANFLAINLAHDLVMGKKSVREARKAYTEAVSEMKHPEYMKGLIFTPPMGMQGDPDMATIDKSKMSMMKQPG